MRSHSESTAIVDDHHLGMHERGDVARPRRHGIHEAQPAMPVGSDQHLERLVPQHAHRLLLDPAFAFLRHDDDHFGAVQLLQPLCEGAGERVVREVLALDVDRAFRRGDRVEIRPLALANRLVPFRRRRRRSSDRV
jgi:hypothetical protein